MRICKSCFEPISKKSSSKLCKHCLSLNIDYQRQKQTKVRPHRKKTWQEDWE